MKSNPEKEILKARFKALSRATKLYLIFNLLALVFGAFICSLFVTREASALSAMAETILIFSVVYIFLTTLIISVSSRYNQERNIIAGIIPLIMALIGLTLAFWLYDEYLSDQLGSGSIVIACFALVFPPLISIALRRALSLAVGKLYLLNLLQIATTGLLAWLEFAFLI